MVVDDRRTPTIAVAGIGLRRRTEVKRMDTRPAAESTGRIGRPGESRRAVHRGDAGIDATYGLTFRPLSQPGEPA